MLFAGWRPAVADSSHARIIRLSLVQGDVRFTRDVHGDPLTSDRAAWEGATVNLPIRQGYVLATDKGRAEVEFENGSMAFLSEDTVLEFYDLSLEDGAKTTRLILRQGTASFYVNPTNGDYFSVTGGDFSVEADGRSGFRSTISTTAASSTSLKAACRCCARIKPPTWPRGSLSRCVPAIPLPSAWAKFPTMTSLTAGSL